MAKLLLSFLLLGIGPLLLAQDEGAVTPCEPGSVTVDGTTYPYRLLRPRAEERATATPLVVFLHGAGERGTDNERQLTWLVNDMARPAAMRRWPCHVLAVQCPKGERWVDVDWSDKHSSEWPQEPSPAMRAVLAAMDQVIAAERIDPGRVYLTGLSMGGYGAWDLAMRQPDRFAALLAVCGGGDERRAGTLLGLPIQVWHGDADRAVPVERSRQMVDALQWCGADVTYHELPGVGHDSWRQAYGSSGSMEWLFEQDQRRQRRGVFRTFAVVPAPVKVRLDEGRFALAGRPRAILGAGCEAAARLLAIGLGQFGGRVIETATGEPRSGDVTIDLDPTLEEAIAVEIDSVLHVRVREAAAVPRAAAVILMALATWPDGSCPRGGFVVTELPRRGTIRTDTEIESWPPTEVLELVQLAWLFGADRIVGPGFDRAFAEIGPEFALEVRSITTAAGVVLQSADAEAEEPGWKVRLDAPFAPREFLSQLCPVEGRWQLESTIGLPADQLRWLLRAMPWLVERAARPRGLIDADELSSRLGALLRGG